MIAASIERARELADGGDKQGAARLLSDYLEATPGDAFAHFQLANLMLSMGCLLYTS